MIKGKIYFMNDKSNIEYTTKSHFYI